MEKKSTSERNLKKLSGSQHEFMGLVIYWEYIMFEYEIENWTFTYSVILFTGHSHSCFCDKFTCI